MKTQFYWVNEISKNYVEIDLMDQIESTLFSSWLNSMWKPITARENPIDLD